MTDPTVTTPGWAPVTEADAVARHNAQLVLEVAQLRRELGAVRTVLATEVARLDRILGPAPVRRQVAKSGFVESPDLGPTTNEGGGCG